MLATIRLFKAVPVDKSAQGQDFLPFEVYRRTLPKGFVFAPEVIASYGNIDNLIDQVDAACGLDPNRLNKAFHKSFGKVKAASMEQLFVEQIAHYITTYGAESLGIFDADRVYIPTERLDVPAIDIESFDFVVIRGLSLAEIKIALLDLLSTGAALSQQSVKDCLEVASLVNLTIYETEQVRNREVKIGLYELYGRVPSDPVEFLRYVVYKTTGSTLLIKNRSTIDAVKQGATTHNLVPLFNLYNNFGSLDRLAEIFFRFKPLFLALREDKALRPTINRIRRLAEKNHRPMPEDYLNSVTASIKKSDLFPVISKKDSRTTLGTISVINDFDFNRLAFELDSPNVSIFRKIRLANALSIRADADNDAMVYRIRNGKSYATTVEKPSEVVARNSARAYSTVIESIVAELIPTFYGKGVYIPEGVVYGLPATEKQFVGNLPAGTSVRTPVDQPLVVGVYWEDQGHSRIDLDLSLSNLSGKIGWDGSYRGEGRRVLFSGDNTSAPNGASEVFWFDPSVDGSWMVNVNYYNYYENLPVPFKIVVCTADVSDINSNFVINPNKLIASASAVLDIQQMNLGVVVAESSGSHRFFFSAAAGGGGRTSRYNTHAEAARKFMVASLLNAPTLNEVIVQAGGTIVGDLSEADSGFNLSPQAVDKSTFLTLLTQGR